MVPVNTVPSPCSYHLRGHRVASPRRRIRGGRAAMPAGGMPTAAIWHWWTPRPAVSAPHRGPDALGNGHLPYRTAHWRTVPARPRRCVLLGAGRQCRGPDHLRAPPRAGCSWRRPTTRAGNCTRAAPPVCGTRRARRRCGPPPAIAAGGLYARLFASRHRRSGIGRCGHPHAWPAHAILQSPGPARMRSPPGAPEVPGPPSRIAVPGEVTPIDRPSVLPAVPAPGGRRGRLPFLHVLGSPHGRAGRRFLPAPLLRRPRPLGVHRRQPERLARVERAVHRMDRHRAPPRPVPPRAATKTGTSGAGTAGASRGASRCRTAALSSTPRSTTSSNLRAAV